MKSVDVIKREHRSLNALLYTLKRLVEGDGRDGVDVPFRVYHGILHYIDSFLDRYHHPKENSHLFPKVLERAPESAELVQRLGNEHARGDALMNGLLRALSAYEFLGEKARPDFRRAVEEYVEFERQHARAEEKELLPIAVEKLTESDWAQIDAVFTDHEDPLFGDRRRQEFNELHEILTRTVPAPYGLG